MAGVDPEQAMEQRTTGAVVRVRPLSETSLIVHWLTLDHGRIATVAKGARRPKSTFLGKLNLYFTADLSFKPAKRGDLHALLEVAVRESRPRLRTDYAALRAAAYATAFIEQMTETDTPLPEIYELFDGFLDHLSSVAPLPRAIYAFELRLLSALGLDLEVGPGPSSMRQLVQNLRWLPWSDLAALRPGASEIRELRQTLRRFILQHCGKLPAGREGVVAGERG